MPVKKILFCTDFSENSEAARRLAVEYANAFGAELLVAHVIDSWAGFPSYGDWVGDEVGRFLARVEQSAKDRLEALAKESSSLVKGVRTFCRLGLPAEQIVSLAREESVDLIVTGPTAELESSTCSWGASRGTFFGWPIDLCSLWSQPCPGPDSEQPESIPG